MKIGIIGLLSQQAAIIKKAFPELKIECLSREREREAAKFAGSLTKVVLMTKFISHSTFGAIPTHKREPVAGGMSDLRRKLTALSQEQVVVVKKTPTADKETAMPASTDWSILRSAKVGDVLEFKRPASLSMSEFKQNIASQRSYYKRQYGIHTITGTTGNKVVVEVVNIESPTKESKPAAKEADAGQIALLWANYVVHRCANGTPLDQADYEADAFVDRFKAKFL